MAPWGPRSPADGETSEAETLAERRYLEEEDGL